VRVVIVKIQMSSFSPVDLCLARCRDLKLSLEFFPHGLDESGRKVRIKVANPPAYWSPEHRYFIGESVEEALVRMANYDQTVQFFAANWRA
jgi:hypothetical protein